MIRGIIFDCFGVLYGGSISELVSICPPDRVEELRDSNKQSDYGIISGEEYRAAVASILGITYAQVEEILRRKYIRNQSLIDYAQTLRPQYRIGFLSNVASNTMDNLFSPQQRHQLFDAVVLSFEEHIVKPNPAIYKLMAERLGLTPGECVMIDDLSQNCEGAEVAGMESIQYISNELIEMALDKRLQKDRQSHRG